MTDIRNIAYNLIKQAIENRSLSIMNDYFKVIVDEEDINMDNIAFYAEKYFINQYASGDDKDRGKGYILEDLGAWVKSAYEAATSLDLLDHIMENDFSFIYNKAIEYHITEIIDTVVNHDKVTSTQYPELRKFFNTVMKVSKEYIKHHIDA